ncbi:hypothetical protein [Caulobacter segnis]
MKAYRDGDVVYLTGHCRVEDAETLAALLQPSEGVIVDISGCDSLHAAVVQVLLAFDAPVVGEPAESFLRDRLLAALIRKVD